jgi:thymidylate synthase
MIHTFEGDTADAVWRMADAKIRAGSGTWAQASRGGETEELLHAAFTVRDPRQRWVVSREPALNPAFAIAEVIWILSGRNDAAFLNYWNRRLPDFAGKGETYHGAYGYRLREHFGLDQLERAYRALQNEPDGRQVVLQIWDSRIDFPNEQGQAVSEDIPCNISAMLKVRQGRLEWTQIMRSNDLFLGLPHNFVQFTAVQEVLAGWLGVEPGTYTHWSDSLHLYSPDVERAQANTSLTVEPNTDSLCLPKTESDRVLADLEDRIERMIQPDLTREDLRALTGPSDIPTAFQNLVFVVAGEAARRRRWTDIAQSAMASCANPALLQVWERWTARMEQSKSDPQAVS